MKRRSFLKGTLVTAGAVMAGPVGCAADLEGPRRRVIGNHRFPQSLCSGDPRPDRVVLWTRVFDAEASGDLAVELEVATDRDLVNKLELSKAASSLVAREAHDGCVKVVLDGLEPATHYYYRFTYTAGGTAWSTRTARTKTAPAPDADVPVRFAFVTCQDFNGRYYNVYTHLLQQDIDLVVHLGDYVYETTGDPRFQNVESDRRLVFSDLEGAIDFDGFLAARSLSNYREMYQTYRGDSRLQAVHELHPFVITWDDHEFADDSHGINATRTNGREDEADEERRRNASQAWYEYQPVDVPDYDWDTPFPQDTKIWRDLEFGKHVHLAMTEVRTRRNDHAVPEDAYPGAVVATEAELLPHAPDIAEHLSPYVDVGSYDGGRLQTFLRSRAEAAGWPTDDIAGNVSVAWIDTQIAAHVEEGGDPVDGVDDPESLPLGLAWHHFGKRGKWASLGTRYLVVKPVFDAYTSWRFAESGGTSEQLLGDEQRQWLIDAWKGSDKTWKLWGNPFLLSSTLIDIREIDTLGPAFANIFYVACEDWNSQPNRRDEMIEAASDVGNVVALTGDIHAFFAGTPSSRKDSTKRMHELCVGAVSSGTFKSIMLRFAQADPTLPPTAAALAQGAKALLTDRFVRPNPDLAYAEPDTNGYAVAQVDGSSIRTTFFRIEEALIDEDLGDEVDGRFVEDEFEIRDGDPQLYRRVDGVWKAWDPEAWDWV